AGNDEYEDFCRVKLMLDHVHRHPEELKLVDGVEFETFREAHEHCREIHTHPDNYFGDVVMPVPEEVFNDAPEEAETEDLDILGNRDIDLLYSWEPHVGRYPDLEPMAAEYWKVMRSDHGAAEVDDGTEVAGTPSSLNTEQRIIFDMFEAHFKAHVGGNNPEPILLHVDGRGGTGKSYIIRLLSARLDHLARAAGRPSPVVRAAPTGVAANNISGSTIHSLLRLPISKKGELNTLNATEIGNLQAKLADFLYFIIDEKSMIGLRMLAAISSRMGEVWPRSRGMPFGGRSVLLIGDFFQLPPVAERALYSSAGRLTATELNGRNAYLAFARTVELKQVVRQQGDAQAGFRDALEGLRHNNPTAA
ncbi:PIF1-like helicase-domain-containing protein, partial [Staphylotrichum tortipilum]